MKCFRTHSTIVYAVLLLIPACLGGCDEGEKARAMQKPKETEDTSPGPSPSSEPVLETAYFAAGCFWGVEAAFGSVPGVTSTAVGYMGGSTPNPTYKQVCTSKTGHAETVKVVYDPAGVSYDRLLEVFWSAHDPTTLNRQGPDVGTQYRSAIFSNDQKQYDAAVESRHSLEELHKFDRPIVTEIKQAEQFHMAEEYHQQYLEKQGKTSCGPTVH